MIRHGFSDRLLHRFALKSPAFRRFCFERECDRNRHRFDSRRENLFVAGVARAGSTALLNCIDASDAFTSTCYRHMPFVLAPSLAKLVTAFPRRKAAASERRHGDGIHIDLDSPEALDGVFWSTYLGRDDNRITPCDPGEELLDRYAMFIENLLLLDGGERYLSKMNQRVDLLPGLARYFTGSLFLLPFREPLHQAMSLLRQHQNFSQLSVYEIEYLRWLDHHEFGATHLAFSESPGQATTRFPLDSLDYWLEQWHRTYDYLSRIAANHHNLVPLCYEDLAASNETWQALSRRIGVEVSGDRFDNRNDTGLGAEVRFDPSLMKNCRALYARLVQQSRAASC